MDRKRIITAGMAILVILGAIVSMVGWPGQRRPKADTAPTFSIGTVVADETARLLDSHGRVILVAIQPGPDGRGFASDQVKRFRRALAAHHGLVLEATEYVQPTENSPTATAPGFGPGASPLDAMAPSAEQLLELLEKHRQADAMVFFTIPPPAGRLPPRTESTPRVIWALPADVDWQPLIAQGWCELAVKSRPRSDGPPPAHLRTAWDWFDLSFELVTAKQ